MYYGSRTHNLKLSLELSLELNPGRELFVRGGYMLPYAERQHLYLKERQRLFNRKALLPLSASTPVIRNGEPFNAPITPAESLFFTVGIVWK